MSLPNVSSKSVGSPPHVITTSLGPLCESFDIDATKGELRLTTQFPFSSTDVYFSITLYKKLLFKPDLPVLGTHTQNFKKIVFRTSNDFTERVNN